jgi:hypothetical protein
LLLAWIALRRGRSSLGTLLILALTLGLTGLTIAAWCTVLIWRRLRTVALLRLLLAIALLRGVLAWRRLVILTPWCPVLLLSTILPTGGSTVAARGWMVGLLILLVVAAVDGTKKKLDNPEIRSKIHRRVSTRHLFLLILVV